MRSPDFFTTLGPDTEGRFAVVRCQDRADIPAVTVWEVDPRTAWGALRVPEGAAWIASQRLVDALGQGTGQIGAPSDLQALALYDMLHANADGFARMGMRDPDEGVSLLRALAELKSKSHLVQDHRSVPVLVSVEAPTGAFETHAVLSRAGGTVNIYVAAGVDQLRRLYEYGMSEADLPDFNILHAGFEASDIWAAQGVEDITGHSFMPQVFQYENQQT